MLNTLRRINKNIDTAFRHDDALSVDKHNNIVCKI